MHGALGAQNALLGGGRYDGLSEALGGPRAPGIGFSIGEDRFVLAVTGAATDVTGGAAGSGPLYIAWLGENAYRHAAELARELRAQNAEVELDADPAKLKKSLEVASRIGAPYVLIVGEDELAKGIYPLKDMARGEQSTVSKDDLFQKFGGHR